MKSIMVVSIDLGDKVKYIIKDPVYFVYVCTHMCTFEMDGFKSVFFLHDIIILQLKYRLIIILILT